MTTGREPVIPSIDSETFESSVTKLRKEFDGHNISESFIAQILVDASTKPNPKAVICNFLNHFDRHRHRHVQGFFGQGHGPYYDELWDILNKYFKVQFDNFEFDKDTRGWTIGRGKGENTENEQSPWLQRQINKYGENSVGRFTWLNRNVLLFHKSLIDKQLNESLNNEINKQLKAQCNDYRILKENNNKRKKKAKRKKEKNNINDKSNKIGDDNYNSKCNKIQNLIDPLLNTNKFWIPSIFEIDNNYNVKIITEINNLPKKYYSNMYKYISQIFSRMIPMFEELLSSSVCKVSLKNKEIQVIVDCQNYIIPSNNEYFGDFHREGFVNGEDVSVAGIYYYSKTPNFFSKDVFEISNHSYVVCGGKHKYEQEINVENGMCLVFNNRLINHRLKQLSAIKNKENKKNEEQEEGRFGERGILNFFLPGYKINSTKDIHVNQDCKQEFVVWNWVRKYNENKDGNTAIPKEIEALLVKFVVDSITKEKIEKRNELRKQRLVPSKNHGIMTASVN